MQVGVRANERPLDGQVQGTAQLPVQLIDQFQWEQIMLPDDSTSRFPRKSSILWTSPSTVPGLSAPNSWSRRLCSWLLVSLYCPIAMLFKVDGGEVPWPETRKC